MANPTYTYYPSSGKPLDVVPFQDDCCVNVWHLGCLAQCDAIDLTGLQAKQDGIYRITLKTPQSESHYWQRFAIDDFLIFTIPLKKRPENGTVRLFITQPDKTKLRFQSSELITAPCTDPYLLETIFDCFQYNVSVQRGSSSNPSPEEIINPGCEGAESITPEGFYLCSKKGSARTYPIAVPSLRLTTGATETYRLYYTPIDGCKKAGVIDMLCSVGFLLSNIIHVVDAVPLPYIQFDIQATGSGTGVVSNTLSISGLCDGCLPPFDVSADVTQYDCADGASYVGLPLFFKRDGVNQLFITQADPYIIPEDITTEDLYFEVFRECCNETLIITSEIISTTDPDFTVKVKNISSKSAESILTYNAPTTPFVAQIKLTVASACGANQEFTFNFERV